MSTTLPQPPMSSVPQPPPPMPPAPEKAKKSWFRQAWFIGLVAFVVGAGVGGAGAGGGQEPTSSANPEAAADGEVAELQEDLADARADADQARDQLAAAEDQVAELESDVKALERAAAKQERGANERAEEPAPSGGGSGVTVGQYRFADVQVSDDGLGDFQVRARVTNTGGEVSSVGFKATMFKNGSVVGTATGVVNDFAAGDTVTVDLISLDKYVGSDSTEFQIEYEF